MADIADELETEGSELSKRAARYIRVKRSWALALETDRHAQAVRSLQEPDTSTPEST